MPPGVAIETRPPVTTIRIDRPDHENRLDIAVLGEMTTALAAADADDRVRVVVITGTGSTFCCGGDIAELAAGDRQSYREFAMLFAALHLRIGDLSKPVLAAVNGDVRAGGMSLLAICDLAVATRSARFSMPEIRAGLWPVMAMVSLRRVLSRKRAFELYYLAEPIEASEARELGLVNWVVSDEDLELEVERRARQLADLPRAAVRIGRQTYAEIAGSSLAAAYASSAQRLIELLEDPEVVASLAGRDSSR